MKRRSLLPWPDTSIVPAVTLPDDTLADLRAPPAGAGLRDALVPSEPKREGLDAPVTSAIARPKIREAVIRSIVFRRRLAEALAALEISVLQELRQAGREAFRVGSYVVRDTPTGLAITETEAIDTRQLELPLPAPTRKET